MPAGDFVGFPRLASPMVRVLAGRGASWEALRNVSVPTAGIEVVRLPLSPGPVEILAGGLANPSTTAGTTVSLLAQLGTTTVGEARAWTDILDNDGITVDSIAANTPLFFRLMLWFNVFRQAVSAIGVGRGGLLKVPSGGAGGYFIPAQAVVATHTSTGWLGPLTLSLSATAGGVASGNFTLDFLRVLEYPEVLAP